MRRSRGPSQVTASLHHVSGVTCISRDVTSCGGACFGPSAACFVGVEQQNIQFRREKKLTFLSCLQRNQGRSFAYLPFLRALFITWKVRRSPFIPTQIHSKLARIDQHNCERAQKVERVRVRKQTTDSPYSILILLHFFLLSFYRPRILSPFFHPAFPVQHS